MPYYDLLRNPWLEGDMVTQDSIMNPGSLGNNFFLSMRPFLSAPEQVQAMGIPVIVAQGTADYNVPYFDVTDNVATLPSGLKKNLLF